MSFENIKPKKAKISNKYSWNLYKFMKQHPHYRVFWNSTQWWDGEQLSFENRYDSRSMTRQFVIGYRHHDDNSVSGAILSDIMSGTRKAEIYNFGLFNPNNFTDVSDVFWKQYNQTGRCMFDPNHTAWYKGDEDRWQKVSNNSMKCKWCGKWYQREIEKKVTIKRIDKWIPVSK